MPSLPRNPLVVEYAPQLELLQRASLTITHAGLNTTLESLSCGVPLVAIPITNDQPGVATRITHKGVGEVVPLDRLTVPKLQAAIRKVLSDNSYRENATKLREAIQRAGGVRRAADIVEQVVSTGTYSEERVLEAEQLSPQPTAEPQAVPQAENSPQRAPSTATKKTTDWVAATYNFQWGWYEVWIGRKWVGRAPTSEEAECVAQNILP